jgi:hypothetical protein
VEIGANIETSVGVANAYDIAAASPRVREFGGAGGYDMSRDLGVEMFVGFDQFVYGKGEVELAARALGLEPHTAPFTANTTGSVGDPDRAFREAEGFTPMWWSPRPRALPPPKKRLKKLIKCWTNTENWKFLGKHGLRSMAR